ncbi:MAG: histidine triad nucleotide-binding protein [Anaerolineales bacterium]|jgi:histidine triad (HIT) family protein
MNGQDRCVFCRIAARKAPAEIVYQDDWVTAFRDIREVAPTHVLVIPNKHLASLDNLSGDDLALGGRLLWTAGEIARREGVAESGYRVIINTGPDSGQIIPHLHLHVMGGRPMRHPIG